MATRRPRSTSGCAPACAVARPAGPGHPLKLLTVNDWREAPDAIARFCADHGIARVHANAEWGLNERRRDEAVAAALGEADVEWTLHQGGTLLPPGSVLTGRASATASHALCARLPRSCAAPLAAVAAPRPQTPPAWSADALPNRFDGFDPPSDAVRALARRRGCRRRAAGRLCRRGHRVLPGRPRLPVATRHELPVALSGRRRAVGRPGCARRRRRTWASWTAARPASPPGSMNCCGASSTSTCWPPIPSCRCTGP